MWWRSVEKDYGRYLPSEGRPSLLRLSKTCYYTYLFSASSRFDFLPFENVLFNDFVKKFLFLLFIKAYVASVPLWSYAYSISRSKRRSISIVIMSIGRYDVTIYMPALTQAKFPPTMKLVECKQGPTKEWLLMFSWRFGREVTGTSLFCILKVCFFLLKLRLHFRDLIEQESIVFWEIVVYYIVCIITLLLFIVCWRVMDVLWSFASRRKRGRYVWAAKWFKINVTSNKEQLYTDNYRTERKKDKLKKRQRTL